MDASAWQEQRISGLHADTMKALADFAGLDAALELLAGDAAFEAGVDFRPRRGVREIPQFSLWLAAELGRDLRGRMDLQRELVLRVEDFAEDGKTIVQHARAADEFVEKIFHQPVQIFSRELAVGDDAHVAGAVADFPRLTDGFAGRRIFLEEAFQLASAPDALLEDGVKRQRIELHGDAVAGAGAADFLREVLNGEPVAFSVKWPCARNLA